MSTSLAPALTPAEHGAALLQTLVTLWFAGVALRVTLLAVPPVLPQIQSALALSQTEVGLLSGLPTLLFALVAIPGAGLIARYGVRSTLLLGLTMTAVAGAARALSPDAGALLLTTLAMSAGIALFQPAMPVLARAWAPARISMASAVYSNGMLCSEAIAAALTIPFVLPLVGGSWRWALVLWSLPVIAALALVTWTAARQPPERPRGQGVRPSRPRWWPDWSDARMWKLAIVTGGGSAVFYSVNGFLPGFLTHTGQGDWLNAGLAALNLGQIPPTLFLLFAGKRIGLQRASYVIAGLIVACAVLGIVTLPGPWMALACFVAGGCCGFIITLGFALPALLADPGDVHRLAGAMIAVAYLAATAAPIIGGMIWDSTGLAWSAFAPATVAGVGIAVGGLLLRSPRAGVAS